MQDAPAGHNLPEFAVSELATAIRRTLEGEFGRIRVRGEITELKRYPSGHVYLSLKDADAKIEAVIWKTALRNIAIAGLLIAIALSGSGRYALRRD